MMNSLEPERAFAEAVSAYSQGNLDSAQTQLTELLENFPEGAQRWFALLGTIYLKKGNREAAADAFVREARINPEMAPTLLKNAVSLYHGCGQAEKLCLIASSAIDRNPGDNNLAFVAIATLIKHDRLDTAEPYIPLLDLGQPQQATAAYLFYIKKCQPEKYYAVLAEALRLSPNDIHLLTLRHKEACSLIDFDAMREHAALMANVEDPQAQRLLQQERAFTRLHWCSSEALLASPVIENTEIAEAMASQSPLSRRQFSPAGSKIRIGYLSNDFHRHVVMSVLRSVLLNHDRQKFDFDLLCYTEPAAAVVQEAWPEELRHRIVSVHDRTSMEIARIISDRKIDILVDLKGHTTGARPDAVILSDAPIKVGYLGYPATTVGVDLDYAITDHFVTPDGSKPYFHEKLCRLPASMMPNRPLAELSPQPATRASHGLPEDRFVFCSFNATFKLSVRTVGLWGRILASVPEAIFWVRCDQPIARRNLLRELATHGVASSQIVFAPIVATDVDHISRVTVADLALDTFPYNGHVTTTDMLRAGVPVLAMRGSTCPSRMSEGLLSVFGLPELIAADDEDYVARAIALARNPSLYKSIRERLQKERQASPLFDPRLYTARLERAFEMIAERARAGLAPDHIDVPA